MQCQALTCVYRLSNPEICLQATRKDLIRPTPSPLQDPLPVHRRPIPLPIRYPLPVARSPIGNCARGRDLPSPR